MPYIEAAGARLHVEETGNGYPIVFVHELGSDLRQWEDQVRYFSRAYRCVAYNARGYPPSDVPADPNDYGWERSVDDIAAVAQPVKARNTVRHPQRRHDPLLNKLLPAHPAHPRNHLAGYDIQIVVIRISAPETRHRLQKLEIVEDIVDRKIAAVGKEHQIARAQTHPAAMTKQVPDRKLFGYPRIGKLEFGDIFPDLVIPAEPALIDQHAQRRRGKRLAIGSDPKKRILIHRLPRIQRPHAIAPGMHDLPVLDHTNGNTRYIKRPQRPLDQRVDLCRGHRPGRLTRLSLCHNHDKQKN